MDLGEPGSGRPPWDKGTRDLYTTLESVTSVPRCLEENLVPLFSSSCASATRMISFSSSVLSTFSSHLSSCNSPLHSSNIASGSLFPLMAGPT